MGDPIDLVTDYLEKLIQIPHHLPRLSQGEVESYMSLLFCQHHLGDEAEQVVSAFQAFRGEDATTAFGHRAIRALLREAYTDALAIDLAWCGQIAVVLSDVLKGNPRQTKRFINTLMLNDKLATPLNIAEYDPRILAGLLLIQYRNRDLYELITIEPQRASEFKQPEHPTIKEALEKDGRLSGASSLRVTRQFATRRAAPESVP